MPEQRYTLAIGDHEVAGLTSTQVHASLTARIADQVPHVASADTASSMRITEETPPNRRLTRQRHRGTTQLDVGHRTDLSPNSGSRHIHAWLTEDATCAT